MAVDAGSSCRARASPLLTSLLELFQRPRDILWTQHLAAAARSALRRFAQALFTLICLPFEAAYSLDAILRTVWRMIVTRRHLLEWSTSGDDPHGSGGFSASLRSMWIAPAISIAAVVLLSMTRPAALIAAVPVLALWFVSPAVAWWMSTPIANHRVALTTDQGVFLGRAARRTWSFFETFVGPDDHWLPPDNYQEHPMAVIAHRTSPTNMGLSLLANLAAYDFGYIPPGSLSSGPPRVADHGWTGAVQRAFLQLVRHANLEAAARRLYVSTVDSGNLAGHLLTLRAGTARAIRRSDSASSDV